MTAVAPTQREGKSETFECYEKTKKKKKQPKRTVIRRHENNRNARHPTRCHLMCGLLIYIYINVRIYSRILIPNLWGIYVCIFEERLSYITHRIYVRKSMAHDIQVDEKSKWKWKEKGQNDLIEIWLMEKIQSISSEKTVCIHRDLRSWSHQGWIFVMIRN